MSSNVCISGDRPPGTHKKLLIHQSSQRQTVERIPCTRRTLLRVFDFTWEKERPRSHTCKEHLISPEKQSERQTKRVSAGEIQMRSNVTPELRNEVCSFWKVYFLCMKLICTLSSCIHLHFQRTLNQRCVCVCETVCAVSISLLQIYQSVQPHHCITLHDLSISPSIFPLITHKYVSLMKLDQSIC